jgi:hypothetical protein
LRQRAWKSHGAPVLAAELALPEGVVSLEHWVDLNA